jgi:arabinofuranosyltransferase
MGQGEGRHAAPLRGTCAAAVVLVLWSGWLIYRSSFVVAGTRYFSLFDDAMISMVYAKNFVLGFGLNWARFGPPVEGFSHPLWTFAMIPVNALPLALPMRALVVQVASVTLLVANLFAVRALARDHFTAPGAAHVLPAVALTAGYFPLVHWSIMGMETALQALLVTVALKLTLDIAQRGERRFTALGAVAAAAMLLRLDMALGMAACALHLLPALRRTPARVWLPGAAIPVVALLGYEAFRLSYFGDPLPNTYYLKLTGTPVLPRAAHGLAMWLEFARPIALPLLALAVGALWLRPARPAFALPLAIFALHSAYSIYVGGDVYDYYAAANRFVAPFVPLLFVLGTGLCNEVLARAPASWQPEGRARRFAAVALCGAALLASNGLLEVQVRRQWLGYLGIDRPLFVDKHPKLVERALRLTELLAPDALVATSWAGIPPYFADRFRWVDFLGYNDRHIAHGPAQRDLALDDHEHFDPGHMKWDIPYIANEVRPDAIYLNGSMQTAVAAGAPDYQLFEGLFWLRRDSEKVIVGR